MRSSLRLRGSFGLEALFVAIAVAFAIGLDLRVPHESLPVWHRATALSGATVSWAGWWMRFISIPLLLVLVAGWIWRFALWTRFLIEVSRLRLQLVASHPDHAAGLRFVGESLRMFSLPVFCVGVAIAGGIANRIVNNHAPLASFQAAIVCFVLFVSVIFVSPLTVFMRRLSEVRLRGVLEYGALARRLGLQMERRWASQRVTAETLGVQDFSSTTDLYSITANTYGIFVLPVAASDIVALVVAALLPFVPVVFLAFPFSVVIRTLAGLLQ